MDYTDLEQFYITTLEADIQKLEQYRVENIKVFHRRLKLSLILFVMAIASFLPGFLNWL